MAVKKSVARQSLENRILDAVTLVAEGVTSDMKERLLSGDHVDTGALLNSIRYEVVQEDGAITAYIYADATSPGNGELYWRFLEHGTGEHNTSGNGRQGGWFYYYTGNKHNHGLRFTRGMHADPFVSPAMEKYIPELEQAIRTIAEDISKGANK